MKSLVTLAVGLMALGLGACATSPPPDPRAMLLAACPNAADDAPWQTTADWTDGDHYDMAFKFQPDGVLIYAYGGGRFDNGRWSLDGGALHFDMNDHYADYDGTFDGVSGSGTTKNVANNKGKWTMVRACDN